MPLIAGFGVLIHTKSRRTLPFMYITMVPDTCSMKNSPQEKSLRRIIVSVDIYILSGISL